MRKKGIKLFKKPKEGIILYYKHIGEYGFTRELIIAETNHCYISVNGDAFMGASHSFSKDSVFFTWKEALENLLSHVSKDLRKKEEELKDVRNLYNSVQAEILKEESKGGERLESIF